MANRFVANQERVAEWQKILLDNWTPGDPIPEVGTTVNIVAPFRLRFPFDPLPCDAEEDTLP